MDVFVGVDRQQLPVALQRIVDLDLRHVAVAAERCAACRRPASSDDDEVVDAIERPFDLLA